MSRDPITKEQYNDAVHAFLVANGKEVNHDGRPVESAWFDIFGGLDWSFTSGIWADEATVSARNFHGVVQVQINWSSTHRSIGNALAALDQYKKAVTWAGKIDSFLANLGPVELKAKAEDIIGN